MKKPTLSEALALSASLHIPLHPVFTYFWSNLTSVEQVEKLRQWLLKSEIQGNDNLAEKVVGENDAEVKKSLEQICLPHKVADGKIIVEGDDAAAFALSLGYKVPCTQGHLKPRLFWKL